MAETVYDYVREYFEQVEAERKAKRQAMYEAIVRREIICRMIIAGCSDEFISKINKLSAEDVQHIRSQLINDYNNWKSVSAIRFIRMGCADEVIATALDFPLVEVQRIRDKLSSNEHTDWKPEAASRFIQMGFTDELVAAGLDFPLEEVQRIHWQQASI